MHKIIINMSCLRRLKVLGMKMERGQALGITSATTFRVTYIYINIFFVYNQQFFYVVTT